MRTAFRAALARLLLPSSMALGVGALQGGFQFALLAGRKPGRRLASEDRWLTQHEARRWSGGDTCLVQYPPLGFTLASDIANNQYSGSQLIPFLYLPLYSMGEEASGLPSFLPFHLHPKDFPRHCVESTTLRFMLSWLPMLGNVVL